MASVEDRESNTQSYENQATSYYMPVFCREEAEILFVRLFRQKRLWLMHIT